VKDNANPDVTQDLISLLKKTQPEVVYTHNLADKHPTHVGVGMRVIQAIRALEKSERPKVLYGCEVWRDLDWMVDQDKVVFDLSSHENLQAALLGVFDSQICGGKRYDLATMGRRKAHATYFESHGVDQASGINFGMDLSPLIQDDSLSISGYVEDHLNRFRTSIIENIVKFQ
jgi:LmbE family N-acetylglucosaminyl deacetylase